MPSKPIALEVASVTSAQLTLTLNLLTIDNGGLPLEGFMLEITSDIQSGFTQIELSGESQHTLTAADDNLVEGHIYTVRWFVLNSKGQSLPSDEIKVALVDTLQAPSKITKVDSSLTSVSLQWTSVVAGVSPGGEILGYLLDVKNPATSESWTAFDGASQGLPDQTEFTVYGLLTGNAYLFKVSAVGFNG